MARLVLADAAERLLERRDRGALVHRVEQGGGGRLAEHEGGEQERQRVLVHALLEALPVAGAVVIQPLDVVAGELAERRLWLVAERPAGREQLDRAAAHLLVVDLVAGDREEALADRVFLVGLVGVDHGAREHRRAGAVEHREQREPVGERVALIEAVRARVDRVPGQPRGRPARIARLLVDLQELRRLDVPLDREDVHRRQRRRVLGAEQELFGVGLPVGHEGRLFNLSRELIDVRMKSVSHGPNAARPGGRCAEKIPRTCARSTHVSPSGR